MSEGLAGSLTGAAIAVAAVAIWAVKLHSHFGWGIPVSILAGIGAHILIYYIGIALGGLFNKEDSFVRNMTGFVLSIIGAVCALIFL